MRGIPTVAKRDILRAAKKNGVTIVSAHYFWTPTPGEMVPMWQIEFGPEMDDEIQDFGSSEEAVDWINENAAEYRAALTAKPGAEGV